MSVQLFGLKGAKQPGPLTPLHYEPVTVDLLAADRVSVLRSAPFTYREVGRTADGLPPGYHGFIRTRRLTHGDFDRAVNDLFSWRVHERAGLHIASDTRSITKGTVAEIRLGPRLLGVTAPIRVVYVIDEADRRGFAYGTLPGHPEAGEESFVLARNGEHIDFTITAFSGHVTLLARIGGPVTRSVQRRITSRYLASIEL